MPFFQILPSQKEEFPRQTGFLGGIFRVNLRANRSFGRTINFERILEPYLFVQTLFWWGLFWPVFGVFRPKITIVWGIRAT